MENEERNYEKLKFAYSMNLGYSEAYCEIMKQTRFTPNLEVARAKVRLIADIGEWQVNFNNKYNTLYNTTHLIKEGFQAGWTEACENFIRYLTS